MGSRNNKMEWVEDRIWRLENKVERNWMTYLKIIND